MSETVYIVIITTITVPTIGFIGRFMFSRMKDIEANMKRVEDKANGIVLNYLDRFADIKNDLHDTSNKLIDMMSKIEEENRQQHEGILELVHFIRAKVNEIQFNQPQ